MVHVVTKGAPGSRHLLLGNEAVARGAIEYNVEIAAAYPGTPSSEIVETLAQVADEVGMHVQWSTNEKVAFEVAVGGAVCGKRSLASMKHIGANWIMDPLMHAVYHGFDAGLLLISADDPSGHSSANEQDNRYMALLAEIPALEPSDFQEAKDYVGHALKLSEEVRLPVMLRLVTRICHSRGDCTFGPLQRAPRQPKFSDDYYRDFVLGEGIVGPKVIPKMHRIQHQKLERVEEIAAKMGLFAREVPDGKPIGGLGIVASSAPVGYLLDSLTERGIRGKVGILKLGLSNPFPDETVKNFVSEYDNILVVEEGEPFIERHLISVAREVAPGVKVFGKLSSHLPREGELNSSIVDGALASILGLERRAVPENKAFLMEAASRLLTPRTLTMCAGCPHRAAYYAAKKATRSVSNARYIALGDIGCYTLGMYPPLRFMHDVFCMGSSIGIANGVAKTGIADPVIATIGDSTFYHAGIPALINATFNQANVKVMVLDNEVTAMTGYQPHPGCGETATKKPTKKVRIEDLCKASGIDFVRIVDPYDFNSSVKAMEDAITFDGPAVVIFRRLCTQEYLRRARIRGEKVKKYMVDQTKCIGCRTCVAAFGCPAIGYDRERKKSFVVTLDCVGCGVCTAVCPQNAFVLDEKGGA
ncbi:MAG: indolepyruvate ferredoxin oxidoreductase subunit alpha [Candidatus Verstraetearchaeota archaeon]|nr:indolepyruvate ferredoxin oxidoreductase subunit alpha [Candidatus Verstraetearchaeota archaeon]